MDRLKPKKRSSWVRKPLTKAQPLGGQKGVRRGRPPGAKLGALAGTLAVSVRCLAFC
jgi:hypothetical protein